LDGFVFGGGWHCAATKKRSIVLSLKGRTWS
jgi:hypothetical protein